MSERFMQMDKMIIEGPARIAGQLINQGSKNAALPILAACLLVDSERVTIKNVPHLRDITTMIALLSRMKANFTLHANGDIALDTRAVQAQPADLKLVQTMRASILALGPLLGRCGEAKLALPGGCEIGLRPINLHLDALRRLGAEISLDNNSIHAKAPDGLKGATIHLEQPTVTGTENIIMAATLAKGITTIHNAAREPEVQDLAKFINAMGGRIKGIGDSTLVIEGVDQLHGGEFTVTPDRIEAGTFLIAAAMTRGQITITKTDPRFLSGVIDHLRATGADITIDNHTIDLNMHDRRPKALSIETDAYPGFPTDLQAQWLALNCVAEGKAVVTERIFEDRFKHLHELKRMGANIELDGYHATSTGVEYLQPTAITATDLRAAAGLTLAAFCTKGTTMIHQISHLDRGYSYFDENCRNLGVTIWRVPE